MFRRLTPHRPSLNWQALSISGSTCVVLGPSLNFVGQSKWIHHTHQSHGNGPKLGSQWTCISFEVTGWHHGSDLICLLIPRTEIPTTRPGIQDVSRSWMASHPAGWDHLKVECPVVSCCIRLYLSCSGTNVLNDHCRIMNAWFTIRDQRWHHTQTQGSKTGVLKPLQTSCHGMFSLYNRSYTIVHRCTPSNCWMWIIVSGVPILPKSNLTHRSHAI